MRHTRWTSSLLVEFARAARVEGVGQEFHTFALLFHELSGKRARVAHGWGKAIQEPGFFVVESLEQAPSNWEWGAGLNGFSKTWYFIRGVMLFSSGIGQFRLSHSLGVSNGLSTKRRRYLTT